MSRKASRKGHRRNGTHPNAAHIGPTVIDSLRKAEHPSVRIPATGADYTAPAGKLRSGRDVVDDRVERIENELIHIRIRRHRLRRLLHDRDPSPAVDVDPLSMDADRGDRLTTGSVANPPLRPVTPVTTGPGTHRLGSAGELLRLLLAWVAITPAGTICCPSAIPPLSSIMANLARSRVRHWPAAGYQCAAAVQQDVGLGLGSESGPQRCGQLVLKRRAGRPVGEPVDHVGLGVWYRNTAP